MIVVSRMLWGAAVGIALAAAAVAPSRAAIEDDPHYLKALAALADQRAAEAIEEFEAIDAGKLSAEDRRTLGGARQRTLVRLGQGAAALGIKDLPEGPETDFWRAQALALEGELAESTALMRSVAADAEFSHQREAVLSYAHLLVLQQQHEKAIEALGTLLGSGSAREAAESAVRIAEIRFLAGDMSGAAAGLAELSPGSDETKARAAYLRGRIALATRQWDDAEKIFGPLVKTTEALDIPLHHSVYLGMADAYAGKNESNKAARILKAFIEKYPGSPLLRFAFERLDRLGTFSRVPLDPDAVAWAQSNQAELKGIASYYLALVRARQGDGEEASHLLEEFRANYPGHFLEIDALLQLARLHLEAGRLDAVAGDLAAVRAGTDLAEVLTHLDFLEAETRFAAGDFTESLERFEALRSGGAEPLTASFNAAVAALRLNDHETLNREATFLAQQGAKGLHSELLLERGLYLAALGEPDAAAALLDFAKDHPDHPQLARVHIALAEIFFLSFPPKPVSAREHLELALEQPLSPAQAEDIDYIAVWIEHSAGDLEAAVSLGRYFLDKWPTSPHVPEIHMMLGEMYFRNREYPGAIAQFEALAKKAPLTEHAVTALSFAGKAARLMMRPDSTDRAV
ncbi:MAG: tetratricopeptide repeat protein, partial [Verrucomicrobiales bacterium]